MKLIQLESAKMIGEAIIQGSKKAHKKNVLTTAELAVVETAIRKMVEELEKYAIEIPENIQQKIQ